LVSHEEKAHVVQEEPPGETVDNTRDAPEVVIFVGLQASGKSSFFRERFAATHEQVSKDLFRNNKNRNRSQAQLLGAKIIGSYFESALRRCVERNRRRTGRA
jgi:predicted kinase